MRVFLPIVLTTGLLLAPGAFAQNSDPASDQAISAFVDSHSSVSRIGKIARWEQGVCPTVTGLAPTYTKFIAKRVRDLASQVGAPVNADESCKSNIDVIFTTNPQALLDNVRAKQPAMLGYFDTDTQADSMAVVSRPIQAWHGTQTVDLRGNNVIDSRHTMTGQFTQGGKSLNSSGSRLGDGLHSSYFHAIVVANPDKLGEYEIGTLADHIALLALAQPAPQDACPAPPSILDLTNPGCRKDMPVKALTTADTGYLRGLYQMDTGTTEPAQKNAIAFRIKEAMR
jgi:hypothetical protein